MTIKVIKTFYTTNSLSVHQDVFTGVPYYHRILNGPKIYLKTVNGNDGNNYNYVNNKNVLIMYNFY